MTEDTGLNSGLQSGPELVALRAAGLAEMVLFERCTPEQLQALAERLRPVRAEAGQVLMRQGEQAVSFVLIHSGRAAVSHTGDDGEVVLDSVGAVVVVVDSAGGTVVVVVGVVPPSGSIVTSGSGWRPMRVSPR